LMCGPRRLSSLVFLLLFAVSAHFRAEAQIAKNLEVGINVFGQFTGNTSGNGVTDSPTNSMGGLVNVRQSFHPWLGYEVNYSYTRFSERFSTIPYAVQQNVHEVSAAYLVQAPTLPFLGLQPFGAVGVNYPLITSHLGLRFQYRGLIYKTPDYGSPLVKTDATRQTGEPSVGAYLRF
jgi:hypothetical protein